MDGAALTHARPSNGRFRELTFRSAAVAELLARDYISRHPCSSFISSRPVAIPVDGGFVPGVISPSWSEPLRGVFATRDIGGNSAVGYVDALVRSESGEIVIL